MTSTSIAAIQNFFCVQLMPSAALLEDVDVNRLQDLHKEVIS
jgi:hypothetical protein